MDRFKVVGSHPVAGIGPGGFVMLPSGPATDALIVGGHIQAARAVPTKTAKTVRQERVS